MLYDLSIVYLLDVFVQHNYYTPIRRFFKTVSLRRVVLENQSIFGVFCGFISRVFETAKNEK
jgi:hypothetical protein